ncbi:MAG: hypothetical protein CL878_01000, partial [Dehalococcoidia bacterium]|nr:hypothetical protein [Dehalococcoidia bacterium]
MSPEQVVQHYEMGGFDFIAITDHHHRTDLSELSGPEFLVLPGIEVNSAKDSMPYGTGFHITGINVATGIERRPDWTGQGLVDAILDAGGLPIVAHPYWSGLTHAEIASLQGLLGLEVYNTTTESAIGKGHASVVWDDLLCRGNHLLGMAVDDSHRPGFDSLRGWVTVRAPELTAGAITAALRGGYFYASNGPQLHDVRWEPADAKGGAAGSVRVRCSQVRTVGLMADIKLGARVSSGAVERAANARRLRPDGLPEGVTAGSLLTGAEF